MAWWISGGLVVLGIAILALAVMAVVGRLRPLKRALRRARSRLEQTEKLKGSLAALQDQATSLQARMDAVQERADLRRVGREVSAPGDPT